MNAGVALPMLARLAVLVVVFAGAAGLSNWPRHRSLPEGVGVVTLSFSHGADRKAACRKATPEELAALPSNMRKPQICPRERPTIRVELDIDGRRAFEADVPPSGIAGDGPSRVHQSFTLPAGRHEVAVRMRDRPGEDFAWRAGRSFDIAPADHRVIDFRADAGGFVFH
ncbi:MAG: hypothetical protein WA975_21055 [Mesorhizobium sp.]